MLAPIHTEADMEKFKGKLKGKIVLLEDATAVSAHHHRRLRAGYTNDELAAEALAPDPSPESPFFAPIPRAAAAAAVSRAITGKAATARPRGSGATR